MILLSIQERLCILQHLLDLREAFVLLPEVIRVLVFGEVGGSHLTTLALRSTPTLHTERLDLGR